MEGDDEWNTSAGSFWLMGMPCCSLGRMSDASHKLLDELRRWCPGVVEPLAAPANSSRPDLAESEAYCRQLATSHYENFPLIARLLPRDLRQPFFPCRPWHR